MLEGFQGDRGVGVGEREGIYLSKHILQQGNISKATSFFTTMKNCEKLGLKVRVAELSTPLLLSEKTLHLKKYKS